MVYIFQLFIFKSYFIIKKNRFMKKDIKYLFSNIILKLTLF